jgi:hypothetical protein
MEANSTPNHASKDCTDELAKDWTLAWNCSPALALRCTHPGMAPILSNF